MKRAHPRSRGENCRCPVDGELPGGSSPLTRGKLAAGMRRIRRMRLIPAHAGKTRGSTGPGVGWWAHPRSRGENSCASHMAAFRFGSSPLTRGKQGIDSQLAHLHRLIPAHAGKTGARRASPRRTRAHPRSRGENPHVRVVVVSDLGSSPLTRGKPSGSIRPRLHSRLIPAHAGKTYTVPSGRASASAHPRSRGENPGPGA